MAKPAVVAVGVVVALLGLLFTLQGIGVLKGSSMSDTTFWSVAGPLIMLVGLTVSGLGLRRNGSPDVSAGGTRRSGHG
jgi:hypothetical protein